MVISLAWPFSGRVRGSLFGISQTQPKSRPGLTLRQIFAGKQDPSTQSDKVELGLDGKDLMGFFVGAGPALGPFRLQIDDVRLVSKE